MYKVTPGQLLQAVNPESVINQQKLCVCFFSFNPSRHFGFVAYTATGCLSAEMLWSYGFCSDRSFLHFDTFGDSRTVFCTATISLVVFLFEKKWMFGAENFGSLLFRLSPLSDTILNLI